MPVSCASLLHPLFAALVPVPAQLPVCDLRANPVTSPHCLSPSALQPSPKCLPPAIPQHLSPTAVQPCLPDPPCPPLERVRERGQVEQGSGKGSVEELLQPLRRLRWRRAVSMHGRVLRSLAACVSAPPPRVGGLPHQLLCLDASVWVGGADVGGPPGGCVRISGPRLLQPDGGGTGVPSGSLSADTLSVHTRTRACAVLGAWGGEGRPAQGSRRCGPASTLLRLSPPLSLPLARSLACSLPLSPSL